MSEIIKIDEIYFKDIFVNEKMKHIKEIYENNPNIEVIALESKLTVNYCSSVNGVLIRGLRDVTNFQYENNLYMINTVETVFLYADKNKMHISSTLIRQFLRNYIIPNENFVTETKVLDKKIKSLIRS